MSEPPQKRKRHSFGGDQRLLPRVRQVLSENDDLDAESIVARLQRRHPEYRRKKRKALLYSVTECAGGNHSGRPATGYGHGGARRSRRQ
ncbi:hypothetical protein MRX96_041001 [Rhipicephalus microplus]